jgi:aminopeptidase
VSKWADTLVGYSVGVKPGQQVLIRVDEAGIPLAKEVYRSVIQAGGHPHLRVLIDGVNEILYKHGSDEQLDFVSPVQKLEYETIDSMISIIAPTNTADLAGIDPLKQARFQKATGVMRRSLFERAAKGEATWSLTLFPTPSAAQNAGLSLRDYEEFLFSAMFLNEADPAEAWRELSRSQQKYVDYLNKVETLRFVARDTDIQVRVGGRTWINSDGHRNFPSGEVFTGPIEDSAEGHVRYTFPAAHLGNEVDDIRLTFEGGKVVAAEAARGGDFLNAMLDSDAGARFLGEVAIGTNYGVTRFSRNTLYDEKIGGTFHMALGRSYPETGGRNESALHWDMICDMRPGAGGGAIYADGVLIHENGEWKI